jgi:hypothetical protein
MKKLHVTAMLCTLLAGCSSTPPPPDWKMNAVSLLEHYQARWLEGDSKAAELALEKSRSEIAKTGRLDLLARLELAACGTRVAALEFAPCNKQVALASETSPADQTYAQFLDGQWSHLDNKSLPVHYARLVNAKDDAAANQAVQEIKEPLPRLIAAGLLLKQARATPQTFTTAIDTASDRGWKRPLLTWLKVEQQRAQNAGDHKNVKALQRRIELTLGNLAP